MCVYFVSWTSNFIGCPLLITLLEQLATLLIHCFDTVTPFVCIVAGYVSLYLLKPSYLAKWKICCCYCCSLFQYVGVIILVSRTFGFGIFVEIFIYCLYNINEYDLGDGNVMIFPVELRKRYSGKFQFQHCFLHIHMYFSDNVSSTILYCKYPLDLFNITFHFYYLYWKRDIFF